MKRTVLVLVAACLVLLGPRFVPGRTLSSTSAGRAGDEVSAGGGRDPLDGFATRPAGMPARAPAALRADDGHYCSISHVG